MKLLAHSPACQGILVDNLNDLGVCAFEKHDILGLNSKREETQLFSSACEIMTNSGGKSCDKCTKLKRHVNQLKRKGRDKNYSVNDNCNHRFMDRDQLIQKVAKVQS